MHRKYANSRPLANLMFPYLSPLPLHPQSVIVVIGPVPFRLTPVAGSECIGIECVRQIATLLCKAGIAESSEKLEKVAAMLHILIGSYKIASGTANRRCTTLHSVNNNRGRPCVINTSNRIREATTNIQRLYRENHAARLKRAFTTLRGRY